MPLDERFQYIDFDNHPFVSHLRYVCEIGDLATVVDLITDWKTSPSPIPPRAPPTFASSPAYHLQSALTVAIENNHPRIVAFLLDEGFEIQMLDLMRAVECKVSRWIFEAFYRNGWEINKPLGQKLPPLLASIEVLNEPRLLEWFLAHGANPNASCSTGHSAMTVAVSYSPLSTIKLLHQHGGDVTYTLPLVPKTSNPSRIDVLEYLLDAGALIDAIESEDNQAMARMDFGWGAGNALHYAAWYGLVDMVKLLLDRGASTHLKDGMGRTAAQLARENGNGDVLEILEAWDEGR